MVQKIIAGGSIMRSLVPMVMVLSAAALPLGCAPGAKSKPDQGWKHEARADANTRACVMSSGGAPVLAVRAAPEVTCVSTDGSLHLESRERDAVDIWVVNASSLSDANKRVKETIAAQFLNFKPSTASEMTVAGSPARRLNGAGNEADDNDPGTADVVVFEVGGRFFVACIHSEHLSQRAQEWMMKVVSTAQRP